jgi:hypothetical protein
MEFPSVSSESLLYETELLVKLTPATVISMKNIFLRLQPSFYIKFRIQDPGFFFKKPSDLDQGSRIKHPDLQHWR